MTETISKTADELHKEFKDVGVEFERISPFGGIKSVIAASNDEGVQQLRNQNHLFDVFFQAKVRLIKTKPAYEHLLDLLDNARLEGTESWVVLSALLLDFYGEQVHRQYLIRYFIEDNELKSQYVKTKATLLLLARVTKK